MSIEIKCKQCNKIFYTRPSRINKKFFCCKQCYSLYQKEHPNLTQFKIGHIGYKNKPWLGKKQPSESVDKRSGINNTRWKGGRKITRGKSRIKSRLKRKELRFKYIPLNDCIEDGWEGHHIDKEYVIFIPGWLHKSVWHSVTKNINMDIINDKVYEWFINEYLKR